jgi:hypothetical protein
VTNGGLDAPFTIAAQSNVSNLFHQKPAKFK